MAAFVVIQICFLFMLMLGGVTCRFEVRDCEKKYSIIDFVLEEYNCKFRGDGLYTYEGVKDNIIIKKITFDRLTEKSFLFVDGDVDVVEIFGEASANSEESSTITTDKQPTTISPTSSSSSTSSVTVTSPNVKRTSRPATSNVESKTTGGADMNMCPTTPPMESTTVEAESSSIGWVVGFVVSCIDWMHAIFVLIITGVGLIFQFYRGLRQMYDDMQNPTPVINGPPAPLLPVIIGPPAPLLPVIIGPLPPVINGPPVALPPVINGPPVALPPVINGAPVALPPVINGPPAPLLPVIIGPLGPLPPVINGAPVALPPVINGPPAALPPVINGPPAALPQAPLRRSNRLKNKPDYYHNM
ncbi:Hypothetical predicted protein [Mytilus galloprovincialis]|nr:Hypothetical predicted protein [Mytilus galloprovincialis]